MPKGYRSTSLISRRRSKMARSYFADLYGWDPGERQVAASKQVACRSIEHLAGLAAGRAAPSAPSQLARGFCSPATSPPEIRLAKKKTGPGAKPGPAFLVRTVSLLTPRITRARAPEAAAEAAAAGPDTRRSPRSPSRPGTSASPEAAEAAGAAAAEAAAAAAEARSCRSGSQQQCERHLPRSSLLKSSWKPQPGRGEEAILQAQVEVRRDRLGRTPAIACQAHASVGIGETERLQGGLECRCPAVPKVASLTTALYLTLGVDRGRRRRNPIQPSSSPKSSKPLIIAEAAVPRPSALKKPPDSCVLTSSSWNTDLVDRGCACRQFRLQPGSSRNRGRR